MNHFRKYFLITFLLSGSIIPDLYAQSALDNGINLYQSGNLEQAGAFFTDYHQSNQESPEANYWMGRILFDVDNYEDATEYFEAALEFDEGNSHYHMWLGHSYGRRTQEASRLRQPFLAGKTRSNYEKAVELDPSNIEARESLIDFYLQAPGFLGGGRDKAEEQAEQLMAINPEAGYMARGNIYNYYNETEAAVSLYREATEKEPTLMIPYFRLYTFYFNNGNLSEAITLTEKQLGYNDTTGVIYLNYGNALQRNDQFEEAMEAYENALQLDSELYNVWYQIGRLAAVSGNYTTEGLDYLNRFIELERVDPVTRSWAHFRKGTIYEHLGEESAALESYRNAVTINSDHAEAREAIQRLSN